MDGSDFCELGAVEGVVCLLFEGCGELVGVGDAHGRFGCEEQGEAFCEEGLVVRNGKGVCPRGGGVDDISAGGSGGGSDGATDELPLGEGAGAEFQAVIRQGGLAPGEGERGRTEGPAPRCVCRGEGDDVLLDIAQGVFLGGAGNVVGNAKVREREFVEGTSVHGAMI